MGVKGRFAIEKQDGGGYVDDEDLLRERAGPATREVLWIFGWRSDLDGPIVGEMDSDCDLQVWCPKPTNDKHQMRAPAHAAIWQIQNVENTLYCFHHEKIGCLRLRQFCTTPLPAVLHCTCRPRRPCPELRCGSSICHLFQGIPRKTGVVIMFIIFIMPFSSFPSSVFS